MIEKKYYINFDNSTMCCAITEGDKLIRCAGKSVQIEQCEFNTVRVQDTWLKIVGYKGKLARVEEIYMGNMQQVTILDIESDYLTHILYDGLKIVDTESIKVEWKEVELNVVMVHSRKWTKRYRVLQCVGKTARLKEEKE